MLKPLLGSTGSERVLIFITARGEAYPREISRFFGMGTYPIRKQLEKLEVGGILVSQPKGRTLLYTFNPRYPFLKELKELLDKALSFYPEDEREKLIMNRRRPRRRGKIL
ncbi:MAG TPA: winged helix-turn-helix domain-containing protein [Anaerolineales bacterium]|nr:winged helix-turn-helix domain-containing protein [Anaerolineales bacterium]